MKISGINQQVNEGVQYKSGTKPAPADKVTIGSEKNIPEFLKLKDKAKETEGKIDDRVGLQTSKHNNLLVEQQLDFCIKHKKKVFEIFFDGFMPKDLKKDLREKLKDTAKEHGITLQVHAPITRGDCSWEKVLKDSVDFCSDIGSNILTVHPTMKHIDLYENIARLAQDKGVNIALENYKEEDNTFSSPEQFLSLYNHFVNFPNVGITFDVGHANINREAVSYLKALAMGGVKVLNIHIHDNHGKALGKDEHLSIGKGNINFPELIHTLKEMKYDKNFIVERWENNTESADKFSSLWKEEKN